MYGASTMKESSKRKSTAGAALRRGVSYARVSSKEQEKEGFSIPAQLKLLRDYALAEGTLTLTKSDPVMLKIIDPPTARMFAGVGTGMLVVVCGDARSTRRGVAASQQIVTQAGFEGFF
jgi:predicted site-specific integrase-resolvase